MHPLYNALVERGQGLVPRKETLHWPKQHCWCTVCLMPRLLLQQMPLIMQWVHGMSSGYLLELFNRQHHDIVSQYSTFPHQSPVYCLCGPEATVIVAKTSNPLSGLQQSQLSVISGYPACSDKDNCVVDCLSRAWMWSIFLALDYAAMVADQHANTNVHIGPVGCSCGTSESEGQLRYNPQGKGLCERLHETVKACMRASLRATGSTAFRGYCWVFIQPTRRTSGSHLLSWCMVSCFVFQGQSFCQRHHPRVNISPLPSPLLHLQEPGIIWI